MKTSTQILIDKTIVKVLILFLNLIVRALGNILNLDHSLNRQFETIAICKYKGLGSIVQATPLLQTIRKNYPEAKIIFISTKGNVPILKNISCIDEIIAIDDKSLWKILSELLPFVFKLLRARIGLFLDLEIYSNFSSLITTLSASRNRIGYYLRSSNYRFGIYTHMMYYNSKVPIYQTYLQLARLLGCREIIEELYPIDSGITSIHIDGKNFNLQENLYFAINPNASDLRLERRWGIENFAILIQKIQKKYPNHHLLLLGGKAEIEHVRQLIEKIPSTTRILNTAGKTSIDELIGIIKHSEMLITNDTGPMHISYSLRKKTVALFGPCSPEQYGMNENSISIYHKIYCSPCVHEFEVPPCNGNNHCMKLIQVKEVETAVDLLFQNNHNKKGHTDKNIYLLSNRENREETLGLIKRSFFKG